MITREKLDEIKKTIRDLQMALDFKENMNSNEPFVVLPLSEPVTIVIDEAKKNEVNAKISVLENKFKAGLAELTAPEATK